MCDFFSILGQKGVPIILRVFGALGNFFAGICSLKNGRLHKRPDKKNRRYRTSGKLNNSLISLQENRIPNHYSIVGRRSGYKQTQE